MESTATERRRAYSVCAWLYVSTSYMRLRVDWIVIRPRDVIDRKPSVSRRGNPRISTTENPCLINYSMWNVFLTAMMCGGPDGLNIVTICDSADFHTAPAISASFQLMSASHFRFSEGSVTTMRPLPICCSEVVDSCRTRLRGALL